MRQQFWPVILTNTFSSRCTICRMVIRLIESLGKPLNDNFPEFNFYKVKKNFRCTNRKINISASVMINFDVGVILANRVCCSCPLRFLKNQWRNRKVSFEEQNFE